MARTKWNDPKYTGAYEVSMDPAYESEVKKSYNRTPICLECGRYMSWNADDATMCGRCEREQLEGAQS